jgi:hypothetical protein
MTFSSCIMLVMKMTISITIKNVTLGIAILSKMTFSILTLSIADVIKTVFSIMTFCIMKFNTTVFGKMTLSRKIEHNDNQH